MTAYKDFALRRIAIGAKATVPLCPSDYEQIAGAREVLTEVTFLEEKFFAISENYRELEEFVFKITLHDMMYSRTSTPEFYMRGSEFSRRLLSILSAVRLYQDSVKTHIKKISKCAAEPADIEKIFSEKYDKSYEYRCMEALRNYTQHRAFPVKSGLYNSSWDDKEDVLNYSTFFFFDPTKVLSGDNFKKSVLAEIISKKENLDLRKTLRMYFSNLCEIHSAIRDIIKKFRKEAEDITEKWRTAWVDQTGDTSLSLVAACRVNGALISKEGRVYLDRQIDEYRTELQTKIGSLSNMDKRRVVMWIDAPKSKKKKK